LAFFGERPTSVRYRTVKAKRLGMEDAEAIRELCSAHVSLAEKTKEAIRHMRATADMMDQVWRRCKGTKAGATALSIVGGGLTIGAGIATILTAGVAFPLFISGLVISIVGRVGKNPGF
jgi:hypothetical protein